MRRALAGIAYKQFGTSGAAAVRAITPRSGPLGEPNGGTDHWCSNTLREPTPVVSGIVDLLQAAAAQFERTVAGSRSANKRMPRAQPAIGEPSVPQLCNIEDTRLGMAARAASGG
ncbi:hypothetical protein GCM10009744_03420 [Kribbella alba]|uniref:Uncharacterized protein n=1 Tax=Kribbella alba TaxID=190197 RepID=A0ABN2EXH2_9ACTN